MSEFNQDNQKIDTALAALEAALPKFISGSYTGNGEDTQFISLPFPAKAVYVSDHRGLTYMNNGHSFHYGGLALAGQPVYTTETVDHTSSKVLEIAGNGFSVFYKTLRSDNFQVLATSNQSGWIYHYIALA